MSPFERHGIKHLSASSLNCYLSEPAFWTLKYLFGVKDESGPAAKRGIAVEAGWDHNAYTGEPGDAQALENFALNTNGLADDDHEHERALIPAMLAQARQITKAWPKPIARQLRVETRLEGIEVPLIGYCDRIVELGGKPSVVDLKTTARMPSAPKTDHARQMAGYWLARDQPVFLLYVTDKKAALHPVAGESLEEAVRDLKRAARAVRGVLAATQTPDQAASFFAPNFSHYFWTDQTRAQAERIWKEAA